MPFAHERALVLDIVFVWKWGGWKVAIHPLQSPAQSVAFMHVEAHTKKQLAFPEICVGR